MAASAECSLHVYQRATYLTCNTYQISGRRSERGELHGSAPQRYVAGRQRRTHGERPGLAPLVKHSLCDSRGCQLLIPIGVSNLYPMETILHLRIGLELIWNDLSMVFSAAARNSCKCSSHEKVEQFLCGSIERLNARQAQQPIRFLSSPNAIPNPHTLCNSGLVDVVHRL